MFKYKAVESFNPALLFLFAVFQHNKSNKMYNQTKTNSLVYNGHLNRYCWLKLYYYSKI